MKWNYFLFSILVMNVNASPTPVYKCESDDKVTFSDEPCSDKALKIIVVPKNVIKNNNAPTKKENLEIQHQISKHIHDENIDLRVAHLKAQIEKVKVGRDHKLLKLKSNKKLAQNNLAGATWQSSISQEMAAVVESADTEIRIFENEIKRLQSLKE
ncbi:hypothetical protein SOPP22_05355 [Shewanella sp. OPT22]|nr:hypothetical protein SOPP22_05355 [Shewanella sp. OPT22]